MIDRILLDPAHPAAPKYWRNETTGVLADIVQTYLNNPLSLTRFDIATMRAYLQQWVDSPVWGGGDQLDRLRQLTATIRTVEHLQLWFEAAARMEIDPL